MAAPGDVTSEDAVQAYIGAILERWGRLDILINNAARLGGRGVLDETAEDFERGVRISSLGYFLNTKHGARAMAERGIKGSDRVHVVVERLVGVGRCDRVRLQQRRREQLRPGRRHGPRAVRHPRQQLHAHRADPGQPRS
jgi:NAD(P)-dependent dehydrogenase (short-subunit alcohol dehydrogenase family)